MKKRLDFPRPTSWIALTGFMGVGKSWIGRKLAGELMLHFIDLDRYIERENGLSVPDIFRYLGEEAFRQLETEAVEVLTKKEFLVLSLGGGTFVNPENRRLLLARGPVIALWASPETIHERVLRRPGKRPALEGQDPLTRIRELMAQRDQIYKQAHVHASTDSRPAKEVVIEILNKLWELYGKT